MLIRETHIADDELLMAADGEISARRAAQVQRHLAACWGCRARMAEIEETIVEFARAHRKTMAEKLPPMAGPRALLRAQLAEMALLPQAGLWRRMAMFPASMKQHNARLKIAIGCVVLVMVVGGVLWIRMGVTAGIPSLMVGVSAERGMVPDPKLTPGATRAAEIDELCSAPHEEVVGQVTAPLRQEVFKEYGIRNVRAGEYEVDYLIAPGLGGSEDIRNLWPETYRSRQWNAYAKDELEERLHQMVCERKVDLTTAQREIATDWIAAYKKYFHTDRPLHS